MNLIPKNYVSCGILAVGLLCFCCYVNAFKFIPASITMLAAVLLWIAFNVHFDMFDKTIFSKVLCCSGLLLSIATFFLFAVEEVPFPEGALLFHGEGIALTLLVILLSILPVLFVSDINILTYPANSQSSELTSKPESSNQTKESDDDWEIATEEDIESGDFEIAA